MTLTMAHPVDELRLEVARAFSERERPASAVAPEAAEASEGGCRGSETEQARAYFARADWRDVAAGSLDDGLNDAMPFLPYDEFVYFLPGFVHRALDLDGPGAVDGPLVFKLWSFPQEIASRLEPQEKRAIVHVLEYLADAYDDRGYVRNPARRALDEYWALFTDRELGL